MLGLLAFEEIMIWGIFVAFITAIIYRIFVKPSEIASIKKDIQFYKKKISAANKIGDTKKSQELLGEMMKVNQRMFAKNMKPMMVTLLVFGSLYMFLAQEYINALIHLPFPFPFFENFAIWNPLSWFNWKLWTETNFIGWYILLVLPFSMLFRKLFGVE
ncbi:MAG: DUF106 domain-containing protein [Candidatus Micrarchaeota archaeon]|nr:DUF106 domain-containing protein [Candidatus Micrarchaeota archaeon]